MPAAPLLPMSVRLLALLLSLAALPAWADKLSIDALYGDTALSGPAPRQLSIAPDNRRIAFLRGKDDDQYQLDLWEYNLAEQRTRLLVDSRQLVPHEVLSAAERARRERNRTAALHGITDYRWSPDGRRLLFPLGGELYLYELGADGEAGKVRALTHGHGDVIDPQISPRGRYVSYVRAQNLYVIDLRDGRERALSHDGGGNVHNGEAEFVAQEEMDQDSGYWWAPDDSAIAYKRYDESAVPIARRFDIYADHTDVVAQHYPAAGQANVRLRLGLVAPQGGATRWLDLGTEGDIYLPRVDWLPDGKALSYQLESRDQRHLDLVYVEPRTGRQRRLLREDSPTWINLNQDLYFLKRQHAFIWASERSGYKQLALYDLDGHRLHALTQGDWPIDALQAVDETQGRLWFTSNKDDDDGKQVYAVALDGHDAAQPTRISDGQGWHEVRFARELDSARQAPFYVDRYEDPSTPPQTAVRSADDGRRLAWIEANPLDEHHPYWRYRDQHAVPEFGQLRAEDGQRLDYSLLKPVDFDPQRRYPVMLRVYGGPTAQFVQKRWVDGFDEYMVQHGFLVFRLDNRGADRRGRAFSDGIKGQLGELEVRDQLRGVQWLAAQPYVDARRIGVFGWSYGGYMTLMLLAKGGTQLAGGAAVAPVTDWRLYDTHYTERYLDKPQDNAEGYTRSSVFAWLEHFPSTLFLAHGMADDNVLFSNSTQLMSALQAREIPFELMTYPGAKHGISDPAAHRHVFRAIAAFFAERIAGEARP